MELMQLEMFVALVEERNFLKAAERVSRTQPAVSIAVGKLERGIGVALFDRTRRKAYELTPAGKVLYEYASQMVGLRNEAAALLEGRVDERRGRLSVGVDRAANLPWLPEVTSSFRDRYPQVRVEVLSDTASRLLRDLAERTIDMVLLSTQPDCNGQVGEFVVVPCPGSRGESSFWILQPRVGRSYLAVRLEEALIANLRKQSFPSASSSHRYQNHPLEKLCAQPVALGVVQGVRQCKV
jgi:DNA-binding transcriptional LysR family regulator